MEKYNKKHVLLVIPVHNRIDEVSDLLSSLSMLDYENMDFRINLVDDGSLPPIRPELEERFKNFEITFFRNNSTRGPAYCRNIAVRGFEGDYVWFLDSDSEITNSKVLANMIQRLESDERMAGTGGAIEDVRGEKRVIELDILKNFLFVCRSFDQKDYKPSRVKGIGTNNLILKRSLLNRVGGFSETLVRDEDNDLCLSIRSRGYYFYQDADTVVFHKFSSSGRQSGAFKHFINPKFYLKDMFKVRTELLLKHTPRSILILPFLDLTLAPLVFYRVIKGIYLGRIVKTAHYQEKMLSPKLLLLYLAVTQSLKYYVKGALLLMERILSYLIK